MFRNDTFINYHIFQIAARKRVRCYNAAGIELFRVSVKTL